jgi:predicted esterase
MTAPPAIADWRTDLRRLCAAPEPGEVISANLDAPLSADAEELLTAIVASGASCSELAAQIQRLPYPEPPGRGICHLDSLRGIDGKVRPFITWIPVGYDPTRPTPLFVWLHGGVSRAELYPEPLSYAREHDLVQNSATNSWLLLFPFGQEGAVWWDEVGMANVDAQIRLLKQRYHVDDDRVWLGGFSDGASAAWFYAMAHSRDLAALVAFSGHMGVASLDGEQSTYVPNMALTPIWATHTDQDGLYPAAKMRPTVEMARRAGARIRYHVVTGHGHDLDYAPEEFPDLAAWLRQQTRDPFPQQLQWQSATRAAGDCRWLRIDRVIAADPAPWHRQWNHILTDDRITIGFHADTEYEGDGIRVAGIAEGANPARAMGLLAGDVIHNADGQALHSLPDLSAWKRTTSRGAAIGFGVLRAGRQLELHTRLSEPELYFLFQRSRPSAALRAERHGNRVSIQGSRLGAFTLRLHPDLFDLEQPLRVEVDGRLLWDAPPAPDPGYLLRNFLRERDRSLLWMGELRLTLP